MSGALTIVVHVFDPERSTQDKELLPSQGRAIRVVRRCGPGVNSMTIIVDSKEL